MNKIIKNTIILTLITVIAGLGLGLVYEITKDPIAAAQEAAKKAQEEKAKAKARSPVSTCPKVNDSKKSLPPLASRLAESPKTSLLKVA